MKKDKADSRQEGARRTFSSRRARKPVDMKVLRDEIRELVGSNALAMVQTAMEEVDKGHYLAMKYLFEMIGLFPESAASSEEAPEGESLARTLLRRLQLPEVEAAPDAASSNTPVETVIPSDPVK
jgi:hypothetical protein